MVVLHYPPWIEETISTATSCRDQCVLWLLRQLESLWLSARILHKHHGWAEIGLGRVRMSRRYWVVILFAEITSLWDPHILNVSSEVIKAKAVHSCVKIRLRVCADIVLRSYSYVWAGSSEVSGPFPPSLLSILPSTAVLSTSLSPIFEQLVVVTTIVCSHYPVHIVDQAWISCNLWNCAGCGNRRRIGYLTVP